MLGIIGGTGADAARQSRNHPPAGSGTPMANLPVRSPSAASTNMKWCSSPATAMAHHPAASSQLRANMWALHAEGAHDVVSVATVGGIHVDLQPGVIVIPDQIIDNMGAQKHLF